MENKALISLMVDKMFSEFDVTTVLKWVADNFVPEDVFNYQDLCTWAENNGYQDLYNWAEKDN